MTKPDRVQFEATQAVEIRVQDRLAGVQHYLKQPLRLVQTLVDPRQVEILDQELFRLKMRPMNFFMLRIQPVVDLRVRPRSGGSIDLRSVGCQIRGNKYISQRFQLDLEGFLRPRSQGQATLLSGTAHLTVAVDLPPIFALTPRPLIDATGNGLLKGVLQTMKQRLGRRLLADYQDWRAQQVLAPEQDDLKFGPSSTAQS